MTISNAALQELKEATKIGLCVWIIAAALACLTMVSL